MKVNLILYMSQGNSSQIINRCSIHGFLLKDENARFNAALAALGLLCIHERIHQKF